MTLVIKIYVEWSGGRSVVLKCNTAYCGAGWASEWLEVGHMREILSSHSVILVSGVERDEFGDARCAGVDRWASEMWRPPILSLRSAIRKG